MQILSIWAIVWFVSSPMFTLISIFEKQEYGLKFSITNLITRFLSIMIGVQLGDPRIAISLFALSGLIVYGFLCLWIVDKSGIARIDILQIFGRNLLLFMPTGFILIILKVMGINPLIEIIVAGISLFIYYTLMAKNNRHHLARNTISSEVN